MLFIKQGIGAVSRLGAGKRVGATCEASICVACANWAAERATSPCRRSAAIARRSILLGGTAVMALLVGHPARTISINDFFTNQVPSRDNASGYYDNTNQFPKRWRSPICVRRNLLHGFANQLAYNPNGSPLRQVRAILSEALVTPAAR
jgi:hypothetical protein